MILKAADAKAGSAIPTALAVVDTGTFGPFTR